MPCDGNHIGYLVNTINKKTILHLMTFHIKQTAVVLGHMEDGPKSTNLPTTGHFIILAKINHKKTKERFEPVEL